MARPSDADSEGPPRGRAAASSDAAAAAAAGTADRRVSYIVAPAAALPGRWGLLDVLRLVWRYVRGRVLRLTRRNSGDFETQDEDTGEEPRDAGDVVADEEPRDAGENAAPKKNNHAHMYRDRRRRQIPFVMVGNYRVYKKEKDLYSVYCQERPSSGSKRLCHMCIQNENYRKSENTVLPREMLKLCLEKHSAAGIECTDSDCGVRVHTEQERFLHIHFCHGLPPGWWDWAEYKKLDE